jgi:hypothetical protein
MIALALALAAAQPVDRIGRIYTYVRSGRDGSEAEIVRVYRADRTHLEVSKMRNRCSNAAYVTATLDLERGYATRLGGGRLRPNAGREEFAVLTYDAAARRLRGHITPPGGSPIDLSIAVPDTPWHLFDFDLASLTIAQQYRPNPRASFSFGLPLIWPDGAPDNIFRYLGRADLRFVRAERHNGRRTLRFEAGGPAFGGQGGPIWFDASQGHVVEAAWGIPNHSEYRDFALRLIGVSDGGPAEWRRLLSAHFDGCPA